MAGERACLYFLEWRAYSPGYNIGLVLALHRKTQPAGYFAALAAAYQCNAADCSRHEPTNRGCASGTFKHKYNGEDIRSCNTGSGRSSSRHLARPAEPARTVKKGRLKRPLLLLFLSNFVILVARHCSRQQAVSHSPCKGGVAHGKKLLRFLYARQVLLSHTHYICEMTAFP